MSELNALGTTFNCSNQVSDKVRLISYSEYYNMTPYYTNIDANYPNVENITRLSKTGDYAAWLYCSSSVCGTSSNGLWWTMGAYYNNITDYVRLARVVNNDGKLFDYYTHHSFGVRPIITIIK